MNQPDALAALKKILSEVPESSIWSPAKRVRKICLAILESAREPEGGVDDVLIGRLVDDVKTWESERGAHHSSPGLHPAPTRLATRFKKTLARRLQGPVEIGILISALEELSRLGNGEYLGTSDGNVIAQRALAKYRESVPAATVRTFSKPTPLEFVPEDHQEEAATVPVSRYKLINDIQLHFETDMMGRIVTFAGEIADFVLQLTPNQPIGAVVPTLTREAIFTAFRLVVHDELFSGPDWADINRGLEAVALLSKTRQPPVDEAVVSGFDLSRVSRYQQNGLFDPNGEWCRFSQVEYLAFGLRSDVKESH